MVVGRLDDLLPLECDPVVGFYERGEVHRPKRPAAAPEVGDLSVEIQLFGVNEATRTKVGAASASIAMRARGYRSR